MNVCVLGAGAWGTAMAIHLDRCGHTVTLVPRRMEHALDIASVRENRDYLPGYPLLPQIQIGCELAPVLMEADVAFLACPTKGLRALCEQIVLARAGAWKLKLLVVMCKGLETGTLKLPAAIVNDILPQYSCAVLSGPSFAAEVAAGKPTAIAFALARDESQDVAHMHYQSLISSDSLRVYRSTDVVGTELGGVLKNVYAIAAGMCDGLALGDNAKAALLTRSLNEMVRVGAALGGRRETFFGLSGFGDLIATCQGSWSRNRTFGERIAKGETADQILSRQRSVVEGYRSADCIRSLCTERGVEAPILEQVYAILYERKSPVEALAELMSRELRSE